MLGLPSISVVILAKLNVNWQGLQFFFLNILFKTNPMKSKTPFKNTSYKIYNSFQSILHFKNTTLHVKKKFSPLFADNILPISFYKNISILNTVFIYHIMRLHLLLQILILRV